MEPGDRLICAFVEPQTVGSEFKDWFLHITIVPWFRLEMASHKIAEELKEAYVGSQPFDVKVGREAQFGYKKRKSVNLVEAPELSRLEGQTRRWLHKHKAWVVDEADKTRNFHPHITANKAGRVQEGDSFKADRLYIVEQKGSHKRIAAEVKL